MKLNRLFLLVLTAVSSLTALAINPEYEKYMKACPRTEQGNFDPKHLQSISGRFDGKTRDILTIFPLSGEREGDEFYYDKWIVVSRNATIPSVVIDTYRPILIAEEDLDGNGCDEFTVLCGGLNGCWMEYEVYTFYRSKIHKMISETWYDCDDQPTESIARRGKKKGEVIVGYYDMSEAAEGGTRLHNKTHRITKFLK